MQVQHEIFTDTSCSQNQILDKTNIFQYLIRAPSTCHIWASTDHFAQKIHPRQTASRQVRVKTILFHFLLFSFFPASEILYPAKPPISPVFSTSYSAVNQALESAHWNPHMIDKSVHQQYSDF